MAILLFPDNTVLINFAILNRLDLLEQVVNSNGTWSASVAKECENSALHGGLPALNDAPRIFGEPIVPNRAELIQTQIYRDQLSEPGDGKTKHLGEAETLAIVTQRSLRAVFVTDDGDARRLAVRENVQVISTWDLLRAAYRRQLVAEDVLWGYVQTLADAQRGGPPRVTDRASFTGWLTPPSA